MRQLLILLPLLLGLVPTKLLAQTDIRAEYFLITDSVLNAGELWMSRYMIYNRGEQALPSTQNFQIKHYLSRDQQIDTSDILLATDLIKDYSLPAGAAFGPVHAVFFLPRQIDSGQYFLLLQTDAADQVNEGQGETNNLFIQKNIRIRPKDRLGPDLTAFISDVGDNQGLFHPGDIVNARIYLNNSGNENSPDNTTFYLFYKLCPDPIYKPEKAIKIGGESIREPLLIEQGKITLDEELKLPKDLTVGTYYLFLEIDPANDVTELNEDNNIRLYGKIDIQVQWWKQWWAKLIYLLFSAACLWGLYRFVRKRLEVNRELRQRKREAERMKALDQMKNRLYMNITHEFRTPLTIILGMSEQIRLQYRRHDRKGIEDNLNIIDRNSRHLLTLINQMLDLAKLESDHIQLRPILADIVAYLRYLFESFHSYAEAEGIQMRFRSTLDFFEMDYDATRLQQIVFNLISNAIKFTPPGGYVELEVNKGPLIEGQGTFGQLPSIQFSVKDTGIGIPSSKLPYIFDRFYQADDSHTRKGEGTGIGLALCRELVKLMEGEIEVESKAGKGSTFKVKLPVRQAASRSETLAMGDMLVSAYVPVAASEQTADIRSRTNEELPLVLIIEDHTDVRRYLQICLQETYQVETAVDGEAGIQKAIELIPDLIVSDVMMPKKDGLEVCDTLKQDERTSHIPLILLTAKAAIADKLSGLSRGADAYLTKPFNREELLIRIDQLLQLRKRLQIRYQGGKLPEVAAQDENVRVEDLFLQKVNAIIEDQLADSEFGIDQLCQTLALSRSQLHRKLKALTNCTTSSYIRTIRLQKAKTLLETTQLNISEVAYDVGFSDPNYFSRMFLKEFGQRPTGFRE